MKANSITYKVSVVIHKSKEIVWDFTQDYNKRPLWDKSVMEANVMEITPHRVVKLKMKGNTEMTFVYKLDKRPDKTSLATKEVTSPLIRSGGGYWTYKELNGQTIWTQTNTLVLKNGFLLWVSLPFFYWLFKWQTKNAMFRAKWFIEQ